jgi:hypothetical protein
MNKVNNRKDPLEVVGCARGYSKEELINNLSRHAKFTPNLIKQVQNLPEVMLKNSGTPTAKKIVRMMRDISGEAYRAIQFTRTEINDRGVLYGVVLLKHKVIDKVLNYFHDRWPQCVICLFNEHTFTTSVINERGVLREFKSSLKKVVELISKKRPIMPYFKDIQFSGEEIFETLYNTQNINERNNPRYFKSMIPEYCYKLPGMKKGVERRFTPKNKKIEDFL